MIDFELLGDQELLDYAFLVTEPSEKFDGKFLLSLKRWLKAGNEFTERQRESLENIIKKFSVDKND